MEYRRVDGESLRHFEQFLRNEEKSEATVEKIYARRAVLCKVYRQGGAE